MTGPRKQGAVLCNENVWFVPSGFEAMSCWMARYLVMGLGSRPWPNDMGIRLNPLEPDAYHQTNQPKAANQNVRPSEERPRRESVALAAHVNRKRMTDVEKKWCNSRGALDTG